MKLKWILPAFFALAMITKMNAQETQHDSIHVHIVQNENGNVLDIDTIVAAAMHDQLAQWLSQQGIDLAGLPGNGDSARVEVIRIIGDSLPGNGEHMKMRTTDGPEIIILEDSLGGPHPGMRRMEGPDPNGGNKRMVVIVCDSTAAPRTSGRTAPSGQRTANRQVPPADAIVIYPNPSNGHITVTFDLPENGKTVLTISDMNGKTVYKEEVTDNNARYSKEIDLSKSGKGVYTVKVDKGTSVIAEKIVVQ